MDHSKCVIRFITDKEVIVAVCIMVEKMVDLTYNNTYGVHIGRKDGVYLAREVYIYIYMGS